MLASCSFQTWNRNVGAKTLLGFCLGAFPRFGWSTAFASLFFLRFRLRRRKRRKKRGVFLYRGPRVGPRDHERSNPGLSYAILSGFMNPKGSCSVGTLANRRLEYFDHGKVVRIIAKVKPLDPGLS